MAARKKDRFGLTYKQRVFCDEFLISKNKTQSYLKAYNCSQSSAETSGSKLFDNPRVRKYIDDRIDAASDKIKYEYDISKERIYKELERLAFYDMRQIVDEDGRTIPIHEMDDDAVAVIQGFKADGIYNITEKRAALELLMKAEGMFEKHQRAGQNVLVIKVPDIKKEDGAGT